MSDPPRRERRPATERARARRERRERSVRPAPEKARRERAEPAPEPAAEAGTRPRHGPAAGQPARRSIRTAAPREREPDRSRFSIPPTKRRVLVRRTVAASVAATTVVLLVAIFFTPLLGVRSVDVAGIHELTTADVIAVAQVPIGTPMLRLDTDAIAARVRALPRVAGVDVSLEWPAAVCIEITERDPVAYAVLGKRVHLVDRTGVDYATVAGAPPGLPMLTLTTVSPTDQRTQAVVAVLAALPAPLHALVLTAGAASPGSVTLGLTGGRTIRWGSAADSPFKAQVLAALMTQPGKVYDVSSPELPTIS